MKNKKLLIGFIIGVCFSSLISVGAVSLIYSKDVTYDNTSSGLTSTTVQGALDELYKKAKNAPNCDSNGKCTVTCPNNQIFEATSSGYKCLDLPVKDAIIASGDGLYKDPVTDGRYFYRGDNPNNYITFNGETWRIISIENDRTIKIIRNDQLSGTYAWDVKDNRDYTSTYCSYASNYGCNAWSANSNLIGSPNNFIQYEPNGNTSDSSYYTGTVTKNSTIATYLNETYYNSLSSNAKTKVVKGIFNVSTPGNSNNTESLEMDAKKEAGYQWKGYIALYTITELLRASTNSSCTSSDPYKLN